MKKKQHRATVRVFNLILTFDTDKSDAQISNSLQEFLDIINDNLAKKFLFELPQISIEESKKGKPKIGIIPIVDENDD